ncbi:MAG: AI-2E family transporter [Acidobacteriia bacterium]|nr:AI-2E family transporter [Terriglobia bacterium]
MAKNHRADILFLFGVLIAIWAVYVARDVLLLIYVSALFAVVISPVIGVVQKFRINGWRPGRGFALAVLIGGLAMMLTAFFVVALPPIYNSAQEFASDWPRRLASLAHYLPFFSNLDAAALQKYGSEIVGGTEGLFRNVAGGIFGVFTAIILTAYFVIDGERAFHWAVSMFPAHQQHRLTHTLLRSERRMRNWLLAQTMLMLSLGLCSLVVYFALGIKYFYLLAMYACLANIVPIVGPLSSMALAGTVAAFDSPHKVVGVLIFYVVYQQVESAVISPRVMKSTLDLSPLAVIIALILGGALAGVLGALVSVPTAALVAVFADEYLVQRRSPAVAAD